MKNAFAKTSNVMKFLAGIEDVEQRGAAESSLMVVTGDPGLGKSRTALWWKAQNNAVLVRGKGGLTRRWLLAEIAKELGIAKPARSTQDIYNQVIVELIKGLRPIVLDEFGHAMRKERGRDVEPVVGTLRDISDLLEIPVILVGMKSDEAELNRYKQLSDRAPNRVHFTPLSLGDIKICCNTLSEIPFDDELISEVHKMSAGLVRPARDAIARVEAFGKANRLEIVSRAALAESGQSLGISGKNGKPYILSPSRRNRSAKNVA